MYPNSQSTVCICVLRLQRQTEIHFETWFSATSWYCVDVTLISCHLHKHILRWRCDCAAYSEMTFQFAVHPDARSRNANIACYFRHIECTLSLISICIACILSYVLLAKNNRNAKTISNRLKFYHWKLCVTDLRIAFDLLDRNQDGRVTAGELQFMLKNLGIVVRDELIDDLIKEASQGGNKQTKLFYKYQSNSNQTFSRQWTYGWERVSPVDSADSVTARRFG